jgi:hypothetical protein
MVGSNCLVVYLPEEERTSIYVRSTLTPRHLYTLPPGACPAEPVRAGEQQPKSGILATSRSYLRVQFACRSYLPRVILLSIGFCQKHITSKGIPVSLRLTELETLPSFGAIRVARYVCRSFLHITTDHLCVQDGVIGVSAP